ncbi:MAG: hypothetical protein V2A69_03725 [Pseudomonadota bacterium]
MLTTIFWCIFSIVSQECFGGERYPWQPPALCGTPFFQDETLKLYKQFGKPSPIPRRILVDLGRADAFGQPLGAQVGDQQTFWALNWINNQFYQLTATLKKVGTYCYLYVEDGQSVTSTVLDNIAHEFDTNIYPTDTGIFGSAPDVDGDPKVTILLLDIKDGYTGSGGFYAGYFHSVNEYNTSNSNYREMFYMDVNPGQPGSTQFYGTLAHEFQHMIHFHQDIDEETWINEGCSTLAEFLCGYGHDSNIGEFLSSPDNGLIAWGSELADYGQVYLFLYYLWEKYGGNSLIFSLTQNQQNGIQGVNATLSAKGYSDNFNTVFSNWAVANYLDNPSVGGGKYGYTGLDLPSVNLANTWTSYPVTSSDSVEYYAADYIKFTNGSNVTFFFNGDDSNVFRVLLIEEGSTTPQVTSLSLDSNNSGQSSSFSRFSSLVMIPLSVASSGGKNYSYSTAGITPSSANFQIKRFTSNLDTSTPPNTSVTFTVEAEGETGTNLYYKFWEAPYYCSSVGTWKVLRDFSQSNSFTWVPTHSGKYIVVVHVSDNLTNPPSPIPQAGLTCEVTPGTSSMQVWDITTDLSLPAGLHQPVRIDAHAQGDGTLQYKFFVSPYSATPSWSLIQDWSFSSVAYWTPSSPGNYIVVVHTVQGSQTNCPAQIGLTVTISDEGSGSADIIPGQKMAGITIGDSYSRVVSRYGTPEGTGYNSDYFFTYCYYYSQGVEFVINDSNENGGADSNEPVYMIITASPYSGKTSGGNGIGSALSSVRSEFGTEEEYTAGTNTYWYWAQGITFTVPVDTVVQLGVFAPVLSDEEAGKSLKRSLLIPGN